MSVKLWVLVWATRWAIVKVLVAVTRTNIISLQEHTCNSVYNIDHHRSHGNVKWRQNCKYNTMATLPHPHFQLVWMFASFSLMKLVQLALREGSDEKMWLCYILLSVQCLKADHHVCLGRMLCCSRVCALAKRAGNRQNYCSGGWPLITKNWLNLGTFAMQGPFLTRNSSHKCKSLNCKV